MANRYDNIPDDVKKGAVNETEIKAPPKKKKSDPSIAAKEAANDSGKKQKRPIKLKRAGEVLTRDEVRAIKKGRKKLRKELRARGIKDKKEFELTASSLGLYFDKANSGLLFWLGQHWLATLLGLLSLMLTVIMVFAVVQQMRGHFTVNLSSGMFKKGFSLSETADFENSTTQLFASPAEDVPCISINQIPITIDEVDGSHNDLYFAYTFYLRNEGDDTVDYTWSLQLNSESEGVSNAIWIMLFKNGKMRFYAKADQTTGKAEALPAYDDDSRGYINLPIMSLEPESDQFQIVSQSGSITYYRVVPDTFVDDVTIANGTVMGCDPMSVDKYSVILWLEGDDPDCTDSTIGGHLGVEMNFRLSETNTDSESDKSDSGGSNDSLGARWRDFWDSIWEGLN
jgi:hypothetical protein